MCRRILPDCPTFGVDAMQNDLDGLQQWSSDWQMFFNVSTCSCVHFGAGNPNVVYSICGNPIGSETQVKDLGVWISSDLKSSRHCAEVVKSCNSLLWILSHKFEYLTVATFLPLYKSLIRPKLEYASSCWSPHYQRDIQLLEDVQHKATRLVPTLRHLSYNDRLRALGLQTLETRRFRADLIMLYRMAHNLVDVPLHQLFSLSSDPRLRGHRYKLQSTFIPARDASLFSFAFRTINAWNSLPDAVVVASSLSTFKTLLHDSQCLPEL